MGHGDTGWRYQHEVLRRSLTMLSPGAPALDREEALTLLDELTETRKQLEDLQAAIEKARSAQQRRLGLDEG